jgi:hypothetical protein
MLKFSRISTIISILIIFSVPAYAVLTATQHTTGHIRILNGSNAGLQVSPSNLDFGNVTWGNSVSSQITVTNTGSCVEKVNATASQPFTIPSTLYIPALLPNHSIVINATYYTSSYLPGDYSFSIDWLATCL